METKTFAHGNIATGTLAARYGSDIIGQVGVFYKQNGGVEPQNEKALVKVTGFYNDRGVTVYTFSTVAGHGGGFTRVEGVKFAAYSNQEDAKEVFAARQAAYSELIHHRYVTTRDRDEQAAINEEAKALLTV